MNWTSVIIAGIVLFVVLEPIVILWAIVHFAWAPIHEKFPARAPEADAVRRGFQSFRVGIMNLGFSIHATVDEHHLHLEPAAYLRWARARTVSIPWDAINIEKRSRSGRWITAKVDKWSLMGPAWCLELAESSE
ncbi:MAG: hypothetical protein ACYS15_01390 [Planctomycetota bacterium]|jgi:hypothetical protein